MLIDTGVNVLSKHIEGLIYIPENKLYINWCAWFG